jgi:hypothetical protein
LTRLRAEPRVGGDAIRALALALALGLVAVGGCERQERALREDLPASRAVQAQADAQEIARAVHLYQAAFGTLPKALDELTRAQTIGGVTAGPFLSRVPAPPAGWTAYQYARHGADRFSVASSGGGAAVTAP